MAFCNLFLKSLLHTAGPQQQPGLCPARYCLNVNTSAFPVGTANLAAQQPRVHSERMFACARMCRQCGVWVLLCVCMCVCLGSYIPCMTAGVNRQMDVSSDLFGLQGMQTEATGGLTLHSSVNQWQGYLDILNISWSFAFLTRKWDEMLCRWFHSPVMAALLCRPDFMKYPRCFWNSLKR